MAVLALADRVEGGLVGRLDPDEHHVEARLHHAVHEGCVRGQIEAGLGIEEKGEVTLLLPAGQLWQQAADLAPVADEVIVHHEQGSPPAALEEPVQLRQELGGRLGAGLVAEELDNVAEFAMVGAPAGELQGGAPIVPAVHQIEPRRWRERKVGMGKVLVAMCRISPLEVL